MKIDDLLENLLVESFDKGYQWSKDNGSARSEQYSIELPNEHEIIVTITKYGGHPEPEVSFTSTDYNERDVFAITGTFAKSGINPIRVFSSIIEIMKSSSIIRTHGGFYMEANKNEQSRLKLYQRMLRKYNMTFRYEEYSVAGTKLTKFIVTL
ncbi:hypothetical protein [Alishewanella phage vB_AspM_Slicko01]|nr:hypothetical protein [Alishewanella phage vB_AspM_Slicko01]